MHLLVILLQQLLGMLPSSKKAPQGEVVRTRQPNPAGSDADACQRLGLSNDGWMTIRRGRKGASERPPNASATGRRRLSAELSTKAAGNDSPATKTD